MNDTARQLSPMIFFGTDEVRNDGVRDFRPTAASAIRAEEAKKAAEAANVEEQFSAPTEDETDSDPKDPDPKAAAKTDHPASVDPVTADTTSSALSHPDLDALFGE